MTSNTPDVSQISYDKTFDFIQRKLAAKELSHRIEAEKYLKGPRANEVVSNRHDAAADAYKKAADIVRAAR